MRTVAAMLLRAATFAALILLVTADADARPRRLFFRYASPDAGRARPSHRAPLDPRALYPKYDGGFHSRALQNIGVPTGDIGIRGNGFMMNPW